MKFLLFDRDENYIGVIKYVTSAIHPEALNGEDLLELTTLDDRIDKGFRIVYQDIYIYWKEFIVKGVEEVHGPEGKINYIFCESSFYETIGDYIEDRRLQNATANLALISALEPTRWEVGFVDNFGINSANFYHVSAKEAVQNIVEIWKCELKTRVMVSGNKITHRYVDLLSNRGQDLGKRFVYSKDILEIKRIIERDDVITALYGYGKGEQLDTGGYGTRLTFSEINNGKAYVEDLDALAIWGRPNGDGTKSHIFSKVEFDDVTDAQELLSLTTSKLQELNKPLITYKAQVIDLKSYGLDHEGVELGDTVGIIDKDFTPELRLKAKVIEIKRDLLNKENNEILLGNFRPSIIDSTLQNEKIISSFRDKAGVWDRSGIINPDGSINANILNDLVIELNNKMNSTGGYVYISEDGKGIITYDRPIDQNPTSAIQILGGAIRIADGKLPDGEWNWRTFGTGQGFVADLITTGVLNAAIIAAGVLVSNDGETWINMETGEFNFKNALSFVDGTLMVGSGIASQQDIEDNRVYFEYSVDNVTWKSTFANGDKYIRQKIGANGTWSEGVLIQGPPGQPGTPGDPGLPGAPGVSITDVDVEYAQSTSSTSAPTSGWTTTAPTWQDGYFIWSRTVTTFSNSMTSTSIPACITGQKGSTGTTGKGITSITEEYYLSTSGTVLTGGSWVATPPTWSQGTYMWTRSKIIYNNPTSTEYTTPAVDNAWAEIGSRIKSNTQYNKVEINTTDGVVVKNQNNNIVTQMGYVDTDGNGIKDAYGFKAIHDDGSFSAVVGRGFVRKWPYGEARYLNDIYVGRYNPVDYTSDISPMPPTRINLPTSFRGRGDLTEIVVASTGFTIYPGNMVSSGTISRLSVDIEHILEVVSSDFTAATPYVDVNSYIAQRERVASTGDYESNYYPLPFVLIAVGK